MSSADQTFVGRSVELAELHRGLTDAIGGQGRLFLLAGEPGIGKTRLSDELAKAARAQGALVLWGRCWESAGAPAYWPWTQVVRAYTREANAAAESTNLLSSLTPIADFGGASPRANGPQEGPGDEFEQARFGLFDAMTTFLQQAATRQPLVLILDDLHGADVPSLLLLRFIARELRTARWLIVGTYREFEAMRHPQCGPLLGEIAREGRLITLRGLSRADVDRYIHADIATADSAVVDAVYSATEGNPLFVTEVLHLLAREPSAAGRKSDGGHLIIPDQLRVTIRRRFEPLSEYAKQMLTVASVIGREFDVAVLEHGVDSSSASEGRVLQALDEAVRLGLVNRVVGTVGRYSFSHALLRETLYDDLGSGAQAQIHRRIGAAIVAVRGADVSPYLAEVAHHFLRAAVDGDVDDAVSYAHRVGQRALSQFAYEEAAKHFEQALAALAMRLGGAVPGDARLAGELLLALGDAQFGADDMGAMRSTFQRAAEAARGLPEDRGRLLARAALGMGGRQQRSHAWYDDDLVRMLEEALVALDTSDTALRARVMARLAYTLYLAPGSLERRMRLCEEAVGIARRVADPLNLRWVLNDWRWAVWGPDTSDQRIAIGSELLDLAERLGDRELALVEHTWRLVDLLERADVVGVDAEMERIRQLANELQRPWFMWYLDRFAAMRAQLEGRFAEAEQAAADALSMAQRVRHQDAVLIYNTVLLTVRMWQGRLGELEVGVQAFAANYPAVAIWQSMLAFLHVELGRREDAQIEFERIASQDFRNLPRDYLMLPASAHLCEVCRYLGDRERAQQLYEILEPYERRFVVVGFAVASLGSVARYLGMLAETMQSWQRAADHYTMAIESNTRMRARPAVAQTQLDYARLLLQAPSDAVTLPNGVSASSLLEAAQETAAALGMEGLQRKIDAVRASMPAAGTGSSKSTPATVSENASAAMFQRRGEYWSLQFEAAAFQLPDLLGLRYVAYLLRHPHQEFHVTDLVDLGEKKAGKAPRADMADYASVRADLGDAGPLLDAQAKRSYKERLRELRQDLAEAESLNDIGRVELVQQEMDVLTQELAGAVGLGGRDRRASSHAERARVSITKRIGIALKRIRTHDEALARYLSATLKTGAFCSYNPDPSREVSWTL